MTVPLKEVKEDLGKSTVKELRCKLGKNIEYYIPCSAITNDGKEIKFVAKEISVDGDEICYFRKKEKYEFLGRKVFVGKPSLVYEDNGVFTIKFRNGCDYLMSAFKLADRFGECNEYFNKCLNLTKLNDKTYRIDIPIGRFRLNGWTWSFYLDEENIRTSMAKKLLE